MFICFTRDLSRGSDFIRGGPVIAESWRYDSCRYLTMPLGHLIYVSTEVRHSRGRYSPMLNLTVSYSDK